MKVNYKKSIKDKILEEINKAEKEFKVIDSIELTTQEFNELLRVDVNRPIKAGWVIPEPPPIMYFLLSIDGSRSLTYLNIQIKEVV